MQFKPITAIIVLLLVVASLLVAGCINISTSSTPTPVPTPIPTMTHNPILESAANELMSAEPLGRVHYAKKVTWNGGNIVTIFYMERGSTKEANESPVARNTTLMAFATSQDAAKYIDSLDKSHYLWDDAPYNSNSGALNLGAFPDAITALGTPSAYQHWYYTGGLRTPNVESLGIYQYDNIVQLNSDWSLD